MSSPATFESFQQELVRLVENFDRHYPVYKSPDYNEATLRSEFLDPFFRALGWDVGNAKNLIHTEREVDIEVRTATPRRRKRAREDRARHRPTRLPTLWPHSGRIALVEGAGATGKDRPGDPAVEESAAPALETD